jgi:hypothetical protein
MGNSGSLDESIPKINSEDKALLKDKVVNNGIKNINKFQKDSIESNYIYENIVDKIVFAQIAKEQLKKRGDPLTKIDLIAIIISYDLNKINNFEYLKTLTINDLITIIRPTIYELLLNKLNDKPTELKNNNTTTPKSSKKLEIMDVESHEVALIEPLKKSSSKKTKKDMALVISK